MPTSGRIIGRTATYLAAALVGSAAFDSADAQVVRGVVRDDAGRAVPSALLALVDDSATLTHVVADPDGRYVIRAPRAGQYRIRIQRIGYRPFEGPNFEIRAGETRLLDLTMRAVPVALATVTVSSDRQCGQALRSEDSGLLDVWDQARASIQTALIARSEELSFTTLDLQRTLDRRGRRVLTQTAAVRSGRASDPWRSWEYRALRQYGYAHVEPDGSVEFQAPGLEAFVSPLFIEDHCLRAQAGDMSGEITLHFEPTPERRTAQGISGEVVLDRESATLRRVRFRYENAPIEARGMQVEAGGEVHFDRLPDGRVLVTRWAIKLPRFELPYPTAPRAVIGEVYVTGGELLAVTRAADTLFLRPRLTASGEVVDATTGRPIRGARVGLGGVAGTAVADLDGKFALPDVLPGQYTLQVRSASLDSIGIVHEEDRTITESTTFVVRVPDASTFLASTCGAALVGTAGRGRGLVTGNVVSLSDAAAVVGVRVEADWDEYTVEGSTRARIARTRRGISARSDSTGRFRLCGVPTEQELWVRAVPDSGRSEWIPIRLAADQRAAVADLRVDWEATAFAAFRGVVVDSMGVPLAGVQVAMPELGLSTLSDREGAFRLVRVPPGMHRVTVRRVGLAAFDTEIAFGEQDEEERRIVLSSVALLSEVKVRATVLESAMREFEEHRRAGLGSFVTRDELRRYEGMRTSNAVAGLSGLSLVGAGSSQFPKTSRGTLSLVASCPVIEPEPGSPVYIPSVAERRRGIVCTCYAQVYVDGILQNPGKPAEPFDLNSVPPDQIEAIEWYAGPSQTPARYAGLNSVCGVVVIHRRRE